MRPFRRTLLWSAPWALATTLLVRPVSTLGIEGRVGVSAHVVETEAARQASTVTQQWLRGRETLAGGLALLRRVDRGPSSPRARQILPPGSDREMELGHGLARVHWLASDRGRVLQIEWTGN
jgi:hypothetical protein